MHTIHKDKSKIDLILDNARYQKSKLVEETAKLLGIRLQYLPPYTPNLNLIEPIWKRLKEKISNIYHKSSLGLYETLSEILKKANTTLNNEIKKISNRKIRIINSF